MAVQAKYLFDQDFAPDAKSAEKAMAPAELAIMLAEAESKGYRDGFAAAEKEGTAVATRRMAVAVEQIGGALDRLAGGLATIESRLQNETAEISAALPRQPAPRLVFAQPLAQHPAHPTR